MKDNNYTLIIDRVNEKFSIKGKNCDLWADLNKNVDSYVLLFSDI